MPRDFIRGPLCSGSSGLRLAVRRTGPVPATLGCDADRKQPSRLPKLCRARPNLVRPKQRASHDKARERRQTDVRQGRAAGTERGFAAVGQTGSAPNVTSQNATQSRPELLVGFISHCDGAVGLLDGAARVFVQSWISVRPRAVREAHVVREGALSHGRTKEKNLPVACRHAPQSPGVADRSACRMRQLRGTEAAPPRLQPLWPLRWARSGGSREAAAGRCPGLRPGRGVSPPRP